MVPKHSLLKYFTLTFTRHKSSKVEGSGPPLKHQFSGPLSTFTVHFQFLITLLITFHEVIIRQLVVLFLKPTQATAGS